MILIDVPKQWWKVRDLWLGSHTHSFSHSNYLDLDLCSAITSIHVSLYADTAGRCKFMCNLWLWLAKNVRRHTICSVCSCKFFVCVSAHIWIFHNALLRVLHTQKDCHILTCPEYKNSNLLIKPWQQLSPMHMFSLFFWTNVAKKGQQLLC